MTRLMRPLTMWITLLLIGLPLAAAMPFAAPRDVHAQSSVLYAAPMAQGIGDCSGWANACTLSTALASTAGYEIWIRQGIHVPDTSGLTDPRSATFTMRAGVELYGGFAGTETSRDQRDWSANVTVLSGDIGGDDATDSRGIVVDTSDIAGSNAYRVITADTVSSVVLNGLVITAGQASVYGGGMYAKGCNPELTNVIFIGNWAGQFGGGLVASWSFTVLANVVFSNNDAGNYGGGMYNDYAEPSLLNVTFSGNSATNGGGIYNAYSSPTLKNVVMWGDTAAGGPEIYDHMDSFPTVTYSDIALGYPGVGNLSVDPLFADAANGDVHLPSSSPAVDAGDSAGVPSWLTTDLDGHLRIFGPAVDMGAYESQVPDTTPPTVVSIIRLDPSPTHAASVRFGVTFSEKVIGVDGSDFSTYVTGSLSGTGVTGVSGSGSDYTVTVSTGTGDGDLWLDVPESAVITDRGGNPLADLPYEDSESYIVEGVAHGVLHVAPAAQGRCASWADACALRTALAGALSGDEIWVKAGVHYPTTDPADRAATFTLKSGVAAYGGFAGTETGRDQRDWQTNPTILSGDLAGDDTDTDGNSVAETTADIQGTNSYHVVTGGGANSTGILDGFIVTAGQANGDSANHFGGGMYNYASSPTLLNLTFSGNLASWYGGGMYNESTSSPALTSTTLTGNAAYSGGGMYNSASSSPVLTNMTFVGNSTSTGSGGGMYSSNSSPVLTDVVFTGNTAKNFGGGMYNTGSSAKPALTRVTFSGNTAVNGGGGMSNESSAKPALTEVSFSSNTTTIYGGGMYNRGSSPTLVNVTFWGNSAQGGGGMRNESSSSPTLTNVTFSGNTGSAGGGGISNGSSNPNLINCILWGNNGTNGPEIYNYSSTPTVTYSDVAGGYTGTGNIDADPLFSDAATGNLRLGFGSPAIDAGTDTGCPAADLDGLARPNDGNGDGTATCDMGAYEAGTMAGSLAQGSTYSLPAQSGVSIEIAALGNLAYLYVDEMELDHPNAAAGLETGRYWLIRGLQADKTTDAADFEVNLTLPADFTPGAGDKVCRYTDSGQDWDCAVASHTDTTLTRNNVTAFSEWAVSNVSAPAAVTNIGIADIGSNQVEVTWDAAAGATGYEVWYAANAPYFVPGTDCNDPEPYGCSAQPTTSFTHLALGSQADNWTYRVAAVNDAGASPPSAPPVGEFEFSLAPGETSGGQ